jgi:hypothetical protein
MDIAVDLEPDRHVAPRGDLCARSRRRKTELRAFAACCKASPVTYDASMSAATDAPRRRYRYGARIGSGGMAEVFRSTVVGVEGFERPVAIKRMPSGAKLDREDLVETWASGSAQHGRVIACTIDRALGHRSLALGDNHAATRRAADRWRRNDDGSAPTPRAGSRSSGSRRGVRGTRSGGCRWSAAGSA